MRLWPLGVGGGVYGGYRPPKRPSVVDGRSRTACKRGLPPPPPPTRSCAQAPYDTPHRITRQQPSPTILKLRHSSFRAGRKGLSRRPTPLKAERSCGYGPTWAVNVPVFNSGGAPAQALPACQTHLMPRRPAPPPHRCPRPPAGWHCAPPQRTPGSQPAGTSPPCRPHGVPRSGQPPQPPGPHRAAGKGTKFGLDTGIKDGLSMPTRTVQYTATSYSCPARCHTALSCSHRGRAMIAHVGPYTHTVARTSMPMTLNLLPGAPKRRLPFSSSSDSFWGPAGGAAGPSVVSSSTHSAAWLTCGGAQGGQGRWEVGHGQGRRQ